MVQSTSVQVLSRISMAMRWAGLKQAGLAAEVEDLGLGAEDGGQEAGLAGQASGLAGGELVAGGGLGDPGGGEVGEELVVVDQHDQGGGLAAVAGQVALEDTFEEGDERDALLAGDGSWANSSRPVTPTAGDPCWWWRRGAVKAAR